MTVTKTATSDKPPAGPGGGWWRRPWIAPLGLLALAFLAFSVPPYLTGDRTQARVQQPDFAWHYPVLAAHVVIASVAMITCVFQVWPWFRQRHPSAHRMMGRIYVFGGVLPAGAAALAIAVITPFGPAAMASGLIKIGRASWRER